MANILYININTKKYKRGFIKSRRYQKYTPPEIKSLKTRKQNKTTRDQKGTPPKN
jgi:hypothetical protein